MKTILVVIAVVALSCGAPQADPDAGADAGLDAGRRSDAGATDGGFIEVDAGAAPRVVFGSMTVNGTPYVLSSGYGTQSLLNHQLRVGTPDGVSPQVQVTLVLPGDAGPGFSAACGGPAGLLFASRWIADGGIAFFTLNPTCLVTLSQVATMVDQDYRGTFSGTVNLEPRSVLDAGFPVMTITNGSFTVRRTF